MGSPPDLSIFASIHQIQAHNSSVTRLFFPLHFQLFPAQLQLSIRLNIILLRTSKHDDRHSSWFRHAKEHRMINKLASSRSALHLFSTPFSCFLLFLVAFYISRSKSTTPASWLTISYAHQCTKETTNHEKLRTRLSDRTLVVRSTADERCTTDGIILTRIVSKNQMNTTAQEFDDKTSQE